MNLSPQAAAALRHLYRRHRGTAFGDPVEDERGGVERLRSICGRLTVMVDPDGYCWEWDRRGLGPTAHRTYRPDGTPA